MRSLPNRQTGASMLGTIFILTVLGYGIFIGIQYVPQFIEFKSVQSILTNVETAHKSDPITSSFDASERVIKSLQINEMNDMTKSFNVRIKSESITITFSYDRALNLGFKTKDIHYEASRTLKLAPDS